MNQKQVEDRDALYFPYIHVRDVNWLKATLLSFPQVRRMVPVDFHLNDSDEVKLFRDIEGCNNRPLLVVEPLDANAGCYPNESAVQAAQRRLLSRFIENESHITSKCSRQATEQEYGYKNVSFQIHGDKVIADLWTYLEKVNMAWRVSDIKGGYMPWLAVHPLVGEAIMSTIAIALARDKGLDIVTSSGELHHALVIQNEKEAFNSILLNNIKPPEPAAKIDITDKANQLSEVFMLTYFDLSKLTPNQIGELVGNGHDLRNFKKALIPIAESLPDIPNLKEREKRLKDAGREIIDEWEKHKKSLPKYALDAIWEAGKEIKMPDVCQSLMAGATGYAIGSGIGLTIGFMCYTGYKIWDKFERELHHPYQFLSKIEKAGATLAFQASPST